MKKDKYYKEILFLIKLHQDEAEGCSDIGVMRYGFIYESILEDVVLYLQKYINSYVDNGQFIINRIVLEDSRLIVYQSKVSELNYWDPFKYVNLD